MHTWGKVDEILLGNFLYLSQASQSTLRFNIKTHLLRKPLCVTHQQHTMALKAGVHSGKCVPTMCSFQGVRRTLRTGIRNVTVNKFRQMYKAGS